MVTIITCTHHEDNHLEVALTYEPGYLYFQRGDKTDPGYVVPTSTYEGRFHLRFRLDQAERNPIELPHQGFAVGLDALHARRNQWDDWGGPILGFESGREGQEWNTLSVYAVTALPGPSARDRRHHPGREPARPRRPPRCAPRPAGRQHRC